MIKITIEPSIATVIATKRGWVDKDGGVTAEQFIEGLLYSFVKEEYVAVKANEASEGARLHAITQANNETEVLDDKISIMKSPVLLVS